MLESKGEHTDASLMSIRRVYHLLKYYLEYKFIVLDESPVF